MKLKLISLLQILIISVTVVSCSSAPVQQSSSQKINDSRHNDSPYLILVSLDGYRFDYNKTYKPPALSEIEKNGVAAKSLVPVYPSKTFPNHLSIITGLYAENHGIVGNRIYDPTRPEDLRRYAIKDSKAVSDGSWYSGTPLWNLAEKQGMRTGVYFWPGSEAEIGGMRPTRYMRYDGKTPNDERIKTVLSWLQLSKEERPHLICVYFSNVDSAGHSFGTKGPEMKKAIAEVDDAVGRLWKGAQTLGLPVNLVVVSDHGMEDIDPAHKTEYLDDFADLKDAVTSDTGPQTMIFTKDSIQIEKIYNQLKNALKTKKAKHFKVYKKEQIPARFHYSKSPRIGDLLVTADSPWGLALRTGESENILGNHGYDPETNPHMHGIFYAIGPSFKKHLRIGPVKNIDLYAMMAEILNLKLDVKIDGSPNRLRSVLHGK